MAHDVFISYSSQDKPAADAVCAKLESRGIRCWIAPRDILPGMDWGGAIIDAIEGSQVMALVFSRNADASPQIKREVERAVNKEVLIVPIRIEDAKPGRNLEYFLGTPHWLDAITPPFAQHLDYIADTVHAILEARRTGRAIEPPPRAVTRPVTRGLDRRTLVRAGIGTAVLIAVLALIWWLMYGGPVDHRLVGKWTASQVMGPDNIAFSLFVDHRGNYRLDIDYTETGRVVVKDTLVYFVTADGASRLVGGVAPGSYPPMVANPTTGVPNGVWTVMIGFSSTTTTFPPEILTGKAFKLVSAAASGTGAADRPALFTFNPTLGRIPWRMQFKFYPGGTYEFSASAEDVGTITTAHGGRWTSNSESKGMLFDGTYRFINANTVEIAGTTSTTLTGDRK